MMELQTTRKLDEQELQNILKNCAGLASRIDELHPSEDNDCDYVFIIWAASGQEDPLFDQLKANLKLAASEGCEAALKQLTPGIYAWSETI